MCIYISTSFLADPYFIIFQEHNNENNLLVGRGLFILEHKKIALSAIFFGGE
jgi:hypothetical protein